MELTAICQTQGEHRISFEYLALLWPRGDASLSQPDQSTFVHQAELPPIIIATVADSVRVILRRLTVFVGF